jgi:hypothetical protein
VKSGFFFASKRNEIFASISNFASEAKVRAHPRKNYLSSLLTSILLSSLIFLWLRIEAVHAELDGIFS